jgi:hypothetical protein
MRAVALAALAIAAASIPQLASAASTRYPEIQGAWTRADKCRKLAIEKYPDYTPEETAKRDAYTRRCLNNSSAKGASGSAGK